MARNINHGCLPDAVSVGQDGQEPHGSLPDAVGGSQEPPCSYPQLSINLSISLCSKFAKEPFLKAKKTWDSFNIEMDFFVYIL